MQNQRHCERRVHLQLAETKATGPTTSVTSVTCPRYASCQISFFGLSHLQQGLDVIMSCSLLSDKWPLLFHTMSYGHYILYMVHSCSPLSMETMQGKSTVSKHPLFSLQLLASLRIMCNDKEKYCQIKSKWYLILNILTVFIALTICLFNRKEKH
jgi:hypothetical protein